MKQIIIVATSVLFLLANNTYAKGGGCGGHGSCSHSHAAAAVAGHHSSDDEDLFIDLRNTIYAGYIVYRRDTMRGIIICCDNTISIKATPLQDSTYRYGIRDSNLQAVMLTENNKALFMTRLADKKFYRLLHSGKMHIYDTYFSFNYHSNEFYHQHPTIIYGNHTEMLGGFWLKSVKRNLVAHVNKVYGLTLKPSEYKKKELLTYVTALK